MPSTRGDRVGLSAWMFIGVGVMVGLVGGMGCGSPAANEKDPVDDQPPKIEWVAPADLDMTFGPEPVVIEATATDPSPASGIAAFTVLSPSAEPYPEMGSDVRPEPEALEVSIPNTIPPDDGVFVTVELQAVDRAGHTVRSTRRFTRAAPDVGTLDIQGSCQNQVCGGVLTLLVRGTTGFAPRGFDVAVTRVDDSSWSPDPSIFSASWQVDDAATGAVSATATLDTAAASQTGEALVPNGDYEIVATLEDIAGQTATARVTISIDNTPDPPMVDGVTLSGNCIGSICGGSLSISAAGTSSAPLRFDIVVTKVDDSSWSPDPSIFSASWQVDDAATGAISATATLDTAGTSQAGSPYMPDGDYEVVAILEDVAGQTAEARVTLTVDNTPPAIELTPGEAYPEALGAFWVGRSKLVPGSTPPRAQILLDYRIEDTGAGLGTVKLYSGGTDLMAPLPSDPCKTACTGTLTLEVGESSQSYYLEATDALGNTASMAGQPLRFNIDLTPPRLVDDSAGETVRDAAKLQLDCPDGTLASCQLVARAGQTPEVDLGSAADPDPLNAPAFAKFESRLSGTTLQEAADNNLPVFYLLALDGGGAGPSTPDDALTVEYSTQWSQDGTTWGYGTSRAPVTALAAPTSQRSHYLVVGAENTARAFYQPGYYRANLFVYDLAGNEGRLTLHWRLTQRLPTPVGIWVDPAYAGDLQSLSFADMNWEQLFENPPACPLSFRVVDCLPKR